MTHSDIIKKVAKAANITQGEASEAIGVYVGELRDELARGNSVRILDVGTLKPKQRAARTARNPQTGAPVDVPARTVVLFTTSTALTDRLNRGRV